MQGVSHKGELISKSYRVDKGYVHKGFQQGNVYTRFQQGYVHEGFLQGMFL